MLCLVHSAVCKHAGRWQREGGMQMYVNTGMQMYVNPGCLTACGHSPLCPANSLAGGVAPESAGTALGNVCLLRRKTQGREDGSG